MPPAPKRVSDLDRNDVEGALTVARRLLAEARTNGDTDTSFMESLIMLQDDPDEFIARACAEFGTD